MAHKGKEVLGWQECSAGMRAVEGTSWDLPDLQLSPRQGGSKEGCWEMRGGSCPKKIPARKDLKLHWEIPPWSWGAGVQESRQDVEGEPFLF